MDKIVIDKDILEILSRLKNKMDYRVIFMILEHKCIEEEKITAQLRISVKTLQKSLKRLIDLELVKRVRHKSRHDVYVMLNKKFFTASGCLDCKYASEGFLGTIACSLKDLKCLYDYERICHGLWNMMKNDYEEINALENLRGKIGKGGQTKDDINEWGYKDFSLFYTEQFKIHFPDAIEQTEMLSVRINIKKLMKLIREKVQNSKWRYVVKHYISKRMSECLELKTLINPSMLLEPVSIRKFLEGKGLKISNLEYCKQHDIFCPYMKNEKCELDRSNTSCDDELIERMKERYN